MPRVPVKLMGDHRASDGYKFVEPQGNIVHHAPRHEQNSTDVHRLQKKNSRPYVAIALLPMFDHLRVCNPMLHHAQEVLYWLDHTTCRIWSDWYGDESKPTRLYGIYGKCLSLCLFSHYTITYVREIDIHLPHILVFTSVLTKGLTDSRELSLRPPVVTTIPTI